jgi:hypothetical protein
MKNTTIIPGGVHVGVSSPAPTPYRYSEGTEDWSSLLPSWQIICLVLAISLLVCWLRAHPGTLAYIKCLRGGPEGRWIAVQQDIEEDDYDDEQDEEAGDAERTRAISMKYRELRNEGYSTSEAMELAESIVSLNPRPRNGSFKVADDGDAPAIKGSENDTGSKPVEGDVTKSSEKNNLKKANKLEKNNSLKKDSIDKADKSPPSSPVNSKDGKVKISGIRNGLKNVLKPKQAADGKIIPEVLKVVEVAEEDQWFPGAYPRTKPLHMKKLQNEEKKLQRYRMLQKEGYDDAQARFLAGLPREDNEEEFLWSEVRC